MRDIVLVELEKQRDTITLEPDSANREIARLMQENVALNEKLREMRNEISLWIKRHLETLHYRSPKESDRNDHHPHGWAVAEIPDWELRQKLEYLEDSPNKK